MIQPNMATTLGFVMTDAVLSPGELRGILLNATDATYNCLTVDGDTSTNDMVALLANGASKVRPAGKERKVLEGAIRFVMESLAKQIAADGEGARKLITVEAAGFKTVEDARKVARAIANSPLVKTAIAGSDPNWGRILAAAGYSGVSFEPEDVDIRLQEVPVCRAGLAADFEEQSLKQMLDKTEVRIQMNLRGRGKGQARFFTCDLTEGYVRINGSYRT
jgi:glutamate N-acetyltransferase/amino-acid N-acetyltransferase